jgi:hypothetical protein
VLMYSADAQVARALLLQNYNDLDIFVEDGACQNMHVRLFNRMLAPSGKKISSVYPLHGKRKVLERCADDQHDRPRRRLYIIDGDEDLILGRAVAPLKYLYRLEVYCMENLLLSERAVVTVATECQTDARWQDLAAQLDFEAFVRTSVRLLLPLFIVYAIARDLNSEAETVRYPVQRLLGSQHDATSLSRSLIRARMRELMCQLRNSTPRDVYRAARNRIANLTKANPAGHSKYISGKTYLFPLIHTLLRSFGLRDPQDQLKVRLAEHCELDIDPGLLRALHDALA